MRVARRFSLVLTAAFLSLHMSTCAPSTGAEDDAGEQSDDAGTGGSADAGGGGGTCTLAAAGFSGTDNGDGTITDATTSLMWMQSVGFPESYDEAENHCSDLDLGTHSDWRLPTIEEVRSLIIDCEATALGGACGVCDDSCTTDETTCRADCEGCDFAAHLDALFIATAGSTWSTTAVGYTGGMMYAVDFRNASVVTLSNMGNARAFCVRDAS